MSLPAIFEDSNVYTVSELTSAIKNVLEAQFPYIWLTGEVSNFRVPASGHFYFTLKDARSQIRAVLFRGRQRHLRFRPEDGLQVLCQGRVSVFEPRGEYQIIIDRMEPHGLGALQLAFEQLKAKLEKEGLFAAERKKPLPAVPQRIAAVTSPTGAAIRDIWKVLSHSPFPVHLTVLPTRVQGEGAADEIARAIARADELGDRFGWNLLIVGRGGGSIEDLWPFNEEVVARAVASCRLPTISAVGHQVDVTISDLVADHRAPTPTAAAEWVVARLEEIQRTLLSHHDRLAERMRYHLHWARRRTEHLEKRLVDPRRRIADQRLYVDDRLDRLELAMSRLIEQKRSRYLHLHQRLRLREPRTRIADLGKQLNRYGRELLLHVRRRLKDNDLRLQRLAAQLQSLSPLAVLARGYSITFRLPEQRVVRRYSDVRPGEAVRIRLLEGQLECVVDETHKHPTDPVSGGEKHE